MMLNTLFINDLKSKYLNSWGWFGQVEFLLVPQRKSLLPMNGQLGRQHMFKELVKKLNPSAIVETGVYRGASTEWFSTFQGIQVFAVESSPRFYTFSKYRLRNLRNVVLRKEDSRVFIRELANTELKRQVVIFYLDAHWENDLPLWEELRLIFSNFINSVVVIDDFSVPGDAGYGYDNYGADKVLNVECLNLKLDSKKLKVFFPCCSSENETGLTRGCVVATHNQELSDILSAVEELWEFSLNE